MENQPSDDQPRRHGLLAPDPTARSAFPVSPAALNRRLLQLVEVEIENHGMAGP
jgi:hypothetical protein